MIQKMKQEMREVLENNILPFWLNNMQDTENGGFYGQMKGDGTLVKDAPKGGILNARILWSFSAAYRVLKKQEYLDAATRAQEYIIEHFLDTEFGGTYWSLNADGTPLDTKKQFYALGFMLYGMTEYVRAVAPLLADDSEDNHYEEAENALKVAMHLYAMIEEHAFDSENNGYIEAQTREWGEIADMRLSELDANFPKSQNTHLHIIEPYTNLYRMIKELRKAESPLCTFLSPEFEASVEQALKNLIDIFCDKILNPQTRHLDLFFEMDWTRGAGRLESYGHDIECSWLLHEAALVLDHHNTLEKVKPIVAQVAMASEKGINQDGSMTHEANLDTGHIDDDRHWWVQAENVVGWMNIHQHWHTGDSLWKAQECWKYIKENLIDNELGEWYWSRDKEGNINKTDDHAGFWKCPYHNSRMCLEIIERDF